MARACFFCGAPATRDDHGIPLWLPPLVGLAGEPVEHLSATGEPLRFPPGRGPDEQIRTSDPKHSRIKGKQPTERLHEAIEAAITARDELAVGEYAVRSLCGKCAATLADLDSRAIPLLQPMIEGEAARYDADDQRLLASWATRMAYAVLAVERRSQGVPKPHRRALIEREEPHPHVFAGYGRYRQNHIGVLAARLLVPLEQDGAAVEGYSVLAVFGHMVVKVFGVHRLPEAALVKPPEGQMVRVWPAHQDAVSWPPLWGLTEQTLEQAFVFEPFYRPFDYSEVSYPGPGKRIKAKRKRTEGLRGRQ